MPPLPAYGYGRDRTESRRIEGPGKSQHVITHRHGSDYQKQSVFASAQHQRLPSRYNSHGPRMIAKPQIPPDYRGEQLRSRHARYALPPEPQIHPGYYSRARQSGPPPIPEPPGSPSYHSPRRRRRPPRHDILPVPQPGYNSSPGFSEDFEARRIHAESRRRKRKDHKMSISSSSKVSSRDISDMDQRSPRGLTFGFSLARSSPDQNSSVSVTQTSETSLGHDGVKGSKNIIEGDCKVYKESIFSVSSSRYTNFLDLGMPVEAELVLQPPAGPTEKSLSPLLTWIHLEGKKHTFDSFVAYVESTTGLRDEEKYKARNLLKGVKQYEKPLQTSHGIQGSYVEAIFSHIGPEDEEKDETQMVFLCLPYFEIASLSKQSPSHSRGTHPLRTLLQYSHGHTSKSRDLKQAVCHLEQAPKGHCFHISYLWCLVIGSDILITCTNLSPPKIQQDLITTKTPSDSQSAQEPQIRVSNDIGRMWLLPVKDCTTWLEFAAHFRSLSTDFHEDYEVVFQGAAQNPANWHFLVERAHKKALYLSLKPRPSPRGNKSSRPRSSASREDSDDDNPDSSMSAGDKIFSASATDIAPTAPVAVNVHQSVDNESKGLDTGRHAHVRAKLPKSDSNEIQIASVNDPYIFLRAVSVPQEPDVSDDENGKAEKVAHPASGAQSADDVQTFRFDMQRLKRIFADMDNCLRSVGSKRYRVYKRCPSRTLQEVETRSMQILREGEKAFQKSTQASSKTMENTSSTPPNPDGDDAGTRQAYMQTKRSESPGISVPLRGKEETEMPEIKTASKEPPDIYTKRAIKQQKAFLRMAKALFKYFLPLEFNSALVAKYWGAVYVLIEDPLLLSVASRALILGEQCIVEAPVIFAGDRTQGTAPPPWRINVPDTFGAAWLHLVMGLVLSGDLKYAGVDGAHQELEAFRLAVIKGRKDILRNLAPGPLEEKQAVLSLGVMSIVIRNLVHNGVPGQPDTTSTYLEYLDQLEHEFERNPYSRTHQEKLLYFRDEVSCTQKVLHDQLGRMNDIASACWRETSLRSSPNDQFILEKCVRSTEERIAIFEEMNSHAINIGAYNIQRIEATKDRQEAAILVFTVVTIIFLPLSFISSLFGMNTYDIRNMGSRQWIFWATGIPVTIVVLGLAVVAILNFDPVRGLWARIVERGRDRRVEEERKHAMNGNSAPVYRYWEEVD